MRTLPEAVYACCMQLSSLECMQPRTLHRTVYADADMLPGHKTLAWLNLYISRTYIGAQISELELGHRYVAWHAPNA